MKESECLASLHAKHSLQFRYDIIKGGITNLRSARKSPIGGHFGSGCLQSTLGRYVIFVCVSADRYWSKNEDNGRSHSLVGKKSRKGYDDFPEKHLVWPNQWRKCVRVQSDSSFNFIRTAFVSDIRRIRQEEAYKWACQWRFPHPNVPNLWRNGEAHQRSASLSTFLMSDSFCAR